MRSEKIARNALLTLALSCLAMAILQLSGISAVLAGGTGGRVSALGFHPNNLARILSLGLLVFLGLAYGYRKSLIKPLYLVWAAVVLLALTVVQTGSRGGLLALAAGVFVFAMRTGTIAQRVRNVLLVVVTMSVFTLMAFQSETIKSRFLDALEEGDLARRQQIYPTAWAMFNEKPLTGWGPVNAEYELGMRLAHDEETSKNAHNMVLQVLMTSGIVGAIPFLAGTLLALFAAWRSRNGPRGIVPLALMATILVANMSGNWTSNKLHWLVVAYAVSSGVVYASRRVHRRIRTGPKIGQPALSN
jgi:O-antigen ligase